MRARSRPRVGRVVRARGVHTRTVHVEILQSKRETSYTERVGSRFATNARHPTTARVDVQCDAILAGSGRRRAFFAPRWRSSGSSTRGRAIPTLIAFT